jgi:hypothetical protein
MGFKVPRILSQQHLMNEAPRFLAADVGSTVVGPLSLMEMAGCQQCWDSCSEPRPPYSNEAFW